MANGIWVEIYNLISNAVFAGAPANYTYGELFCEGFAFIFCAILIALPMIFIWRIIRRFI